MHFHQKIHDYLLNYRERYNPNFNFIVRQRASTDDKNFPGGKFAHGLVFQGTNDYCFVALSDKSGGANATKSVGIVISPTKDNSFNAKLEIVFPGETNEELITFYRELTSKFENIKWDPKETRAHSYIGEFPENDPTTLYNWIDQYFPIIRKTAIDSGIPNLIPNNERFYQLQEKLKLKLKEATIVNNHPNTMSTNNIIKALINEFELNLKSNTTLAPFSIQIYTTNFRIYLNYYALNRSISYLTQKDYKTLLHTDFEDYKLSTLEEHGEHAGKGYRYFIDFMFDKIEHNTTSNLILHGPPGTGKTYRTKKLAVELIDNTNYGDNEEDRKEILKRYNHLHEKEQIVFTTFHQSMSYEDFVEGIKPKTKDNQVIYEVEDGIFKKIANKAKGIKGEITSNNSSAIDFKKVNYFKMSVGGKTRKDIHDWCIENNYIALGYGTTNDLSDIIHNSDQRSFREAYEKEYFVKGEHSSYSITAIAAFNYWMQKEDIVLVSLGNHIIDAIGVVKGDYEYKNIDGIPYHHFRKVEWLATNLDADPSLFVDKNISQQTIYQFDNSDIKVDYLEQTFSKQTTTEEIKKDHVLIIDEINRGNVSAIFGELITLLEPDKRLGQPEAITVKLPYSKTEFGVPHNLHIIGTMNTADRSVEALDTALRRRFEFTEVIPKPELLEKIIFIEDELVFNLKEVLETINNRIEVLIDRDHTIGHSYFITIESGDTIALTDTFNNKVIPLLQEYFYGDYGKIGLVLGNGFVEQKNNGKIKFAKFSYQNQEDLKTPNFLLKKITPENIIKAISETLGVPKEKKENEQKEVLTEAMEPL